ncbi:MAG: zinc-dependent alcohol dehydrogenase [Rubrobacteraceae bacterium]
MKAVVKTQQGDGHIELLDVDEPAPEPGWVVLEVTGVGICGTDIHIMHDEHPYWPPVTLGHEFAGQIAEVGPDVEGWQVGERVVCEPHAGACGVCHLCRRGFVQLCTDKRSPGWGIDGALARYVAVPAYLLHRVPDEVSDLAAAVCEPTAISVSAIERVGVNPGEAAVVLGPGPIGLITAMVIRAMGADQVVVVGRSSSQHRLEAGAKLGLKTWNSEEIDVIEAVQDFTGGRGVDIVVDTSGAAGAIGSGVHMLRKRGRICAVGVSGQKSIEFPWDEALMRAIDINFSFSSSYTSWNAALSLLRSGAVNVEPLITAFSLEKWEDAFQAVESRNVAKAVLTP